MKRETRRRIIAVLSSTVCLTIIGCILPTESCGCTTPPPQIMLIGKLVDGASLPVAGARVFLGTSSAENPTAAELYVSAVGVTSADGEFRGLAYHPGGLSAPWVHLRVVRAGSTDTTRIRGGRISTFRYPSDGIDSTRMTFQMP